MSDPAARADGVLYEGHVMHARKAELRNRFRYPLYTMLVDVDRIDELGERLRLLSVDRHGFTSLRREDHFGDPERSIAANVRHWLRQRGVEHDGRILLQTSPRVFGYVFNPLSVYYCYDVEGRLEHLVAEVHNTYGERHGYLLDPDEHGRVEQTKEFYVSPFFDVDGFYRMRFLPPGARLTTQMDLVQDGETVFEAALTGRRLPLTDRTLLRMLVRYPLATLRTMARIRYQGVKLWLRGLEVRERPRHTQQEGV